MFDNVDAYVAISRITRTRNRQALVPVHSGTPRESTRVRSEATRWIDVGEKRWRGMTRDEREEMRNDRRAGRALKELAAIRIGLQTLADEVFIVELIESDAKLSICSTRGEPGRKVELESAALRAIVKATTQSHRQHPQRCVITPYDAKWKPVAEQQLRDEWPRTAAWLDEHRTRLEGRSGMQRLPWYGYARPSTARGAFASQWITPRLAREPCFKPCLDEDTGHYGGYGVAPNDPTDGEIIAAQLNSERMRRFIAATSRRFAREWFDYSKQFIEDFPIHRNVDEERRGNCSD